MTAFAFVLTELADGRVAGHAVISTEARYASVVWRGVGRVDRRFAGATTWRAVEQEVAEHLGAEPLPRTSAIVGLLIPDKRGDLAVQYLASSPLDVRPAETAAALDAHLRGLAAMPALTIRQSEA